MEKENLPQENSSSNLPAQNNKIKDEHEYNLKLKRLDLEQEAISKVSEIQGKTLDTINNLSNNKLKSRELEAKARQKGIDNAKMFDALNKTIDKKYGQQDRAMDNAEKTLDMALDKWDKDIIMKSLDALGSVANTNPLGNVKKDVERQISEEDFDDDDFMLEI
ncbi:hypothetical protein SAMN04487911_11953 [Arenibacter nanhaiticus]|uniref:Uncharacterized protein n=1 Tax=Arenibacter nanhaiticus TaxID=558155 RepID=A0A1M6IX35_9FLAO|nr:hypothetical protein [Arenibacter nanhaiticus]SHJ39001.1 hypothetical protein SAMN04487911_11953 [Arenibacter nanhaiticus]